MDSSENVKIWWLLMGGGHLQELNHRGSLPRGGLDTSIL